MTGKEYLHSLNKLLSMIEKYEQKAGLLKDMATSVSYDYQNGHVVSSQAESAPFEGLIHNAIYYEQRAAELKERIPKLKSEMLEKIMKVSAPDLCRILIMRYIESLPWTDISRTIKYSKSHTYRLHDQALQEFEKVFSNKLNTSKDDN